MDVQKASELASQIVDELSKVIVGQDEPLRQIVVSLLAGGHALLEGVPGTGKTLAAKMLSAVTSSVFRRIQFTPDLMPSDVVGVNVYNTATGQFVFRPGPVFGDILLADEINRAPAKTQSALLEAMQERQVSVDGVTHVMSGVFTVFATQNPVEFEGTYPLPEAEVDRFMLKIVVDYPSALHEQQILDNAHSGFDAADLSTAHVRPLLDVPALAELRVAVRQMHVEEAVRRYITEIVRATRSAPQVSLGASPRAGVMLMQAAKASALLSGRPFVTPDDVKSIAVPALRHRILLNPEFELEGHTASQIVGQLLDGIAVPRGS